MEWIDYVRSRENFRAENQFSRGLSGVAFREIARCANTRIINTYARGVVNTRQRLIRSAYRDRPSRERVGV